MHNKHNINVYKSLVISIIYTIYYIIIEILKKLLTQT